MTTGSRRQGRLRAAFFASGRRPRGEMERRPSYAVDSQPGNAAMHRIKYPPLRNKINMAEPTQVRAWTRRLGLSADVMKVVVDNVGNSIAAVTKDVELKRA